MTKYGVYIIEFLRADDTFFDGETLYDILETSRIPAKYVWVDTIQDLERHLEDFNKSNFRYLHISCHADKSGLELNGDEISNRQVQQFTKRYLSGKRVFLSACKGANKDLASRMIVGNKALSVLGIPVNLAFDKSALLWPSFYHLMNEVDSKRMIRRDIIDIVKKCVDLFGVSVNFYTRIKSSNNHLRRLKFRKGLNVENKKIRSSI